MMKVLVQCIHRAVFLKILDDYLQDGDMSRLHQKLQVLYATDNANNTMLFFYHLYTDICCCDDPTADIVSSQIELELDPEIDNDIEVDCDSDNVEADDVTDSQLQGSIANFERKEGVSVDKVQSELLNIARNVVRELGEHWSWSAIPKKNKTRFITAMARTNVTEAANVYQQLTLLKETVRDSCKKFNVERFPAKEVKLCGGVFLENSTGKRLLRLGMKNAKDEGLFKEDGARKDRVQALLTRAIENLASTGDSSKVDRPIMLMFTSLLLKSRHQLSPISGWSTGYVGMSVVDLHAYLRQECRAYVELNASLPKPFGSKIADADRDDYFTTFWLDTQNRNAWLRKRLDKSKSGDKNGLILDSMIRTDGKGLRISFTDLDRPKYLSANSKL